MKYDTPGFDGETRRQFNERFAFFDNPTPEVPETGHHIWAWFWELSYQRRCSNDGVEPISASLVRDWCVMTGNRLTRAEFGFITAMDAKFRQAWALETERFAALSQKDSQWTSQQSA